MAARVLVFDSWALLELFAAQPCGAKVESLVIQAQRSETPMGMCAVNLGEVWYVTARTRSERMADHVTEAVRSLGIRIHDPDWEITRQAAVFKSKHKLSFADGFAAALTLKLGGVLVTGDPDFKQLEPQLSVHWLRR